MVKLAWRNIWRNRRRTLITTTSILFAVMLSTFMMALQKGAWDKMVDNVVNFYYGYAQVHTNGYWEDQSIDKAFPLKEELIKLDEKFDDLEQVVPRLESFALASAGDQTSGVLVVGTDPAAEASMTQLQERLVEGEYFTNGEAATIIGAGVGERLKTGVGDTLVLISQGYHGVNAAGKYPVKGMVKFGSPQLNKQMVYLR
jgi:putative ABC transport system permease protein